MGTIEIIEVFPFAELLIEESGVVDHHTFELTIELFVVDAVASLDLPIEARCRGFDVDVTDALVEDVVVE